jgi:aminoglycoside phosphotransferase (APT) family kinase protein
MNLQRMPDAEVTIDESLVRALLEEQHADLASRPLVDAGDGWDNRLFRLGNDLAVRLPRRQVAAALIEHEQRWLPELAPRLPLPVPTPVRRGRPGSGFPWVWSIQPWFDGQSAATLTAGLTDAMGVQLAEFVTSLHEPAPADAPPNPFRTSLSSRSGAFVDRLQRSGAYIEQSAALLVWREALAARPWSGPALWLHGDMHPANLLATSEQLTAVIDFGDLTAGDPAVDLSVAWMLWPGTVREVFRATIDRRSRWVDAATWRRARGWAVHLGLAYLAHSLDNPLMGAIGRRTVAAVVAEQNS